MKTTNKNDFHLNLLRIKEVKMKEDAKEQKMKKKDVFVDDGRVIASMNMEEMSAYKPRQGQVSQANQKGSFNTRSQEPIELSTKGKIALLTGMLKAALLVGVVFIGGIGLFILFCVFVWFR